MAAPLDAHGLVRRLRKGALDEAVAVTVAEAWKPAPEEAAALLLDGSLAVARWRGDGRLLGPRGSLSSMLLTVVDSDPDALSGADGLLLVPGHRLTEARLRTLQKARVPLAGRVWAGADRGMAPRLDTLACWRPEDREAGLWQASDNLVARKVAPTGLQPAFDRSGTWSGADALTFGAVALPREPGRGWAPRPVAEQELPDGLVRDIGTVAACAQVWSRCLNSAAIGPSSVRVHWGLAQGEDGPFAAVLDALAIPGRCAAVCAGAPLADVLADVPDLF